MLFGAELLDDEDGLFGAPVEFEDGVAVFTFGVVVFAGGFATFLAFFFLVARLVT